MTKSQASRIVKVNSIQNSGRKNIYNKTRPRLLSTREMLRPSASQFLDILFMAKVTGL